MKCVTILLTICMMLFSCIAHAEADFDLSAMSPEELQQLIASAEAQLQLTDETMMQSALETILDHWKNEIYATPFMGDSNGYLEILTAQITYIKKEFATQKEYVSSADALFENVYCVIDFIMLSDYYASAPYYSDAGIDNCVVIYLDGTMIVNRQPLFNQYRTRSFNNDFTSIIERVERCDFSSENTYYLVSD